MIDKPLYQNPLGGGLGQIIPNPGAGIVDRFPGNPNRKPPDPIMQGFQESEFRKRANNLQQDAVYFKYKGKDMQMNSSMAGAFKQYLDSIGKGDLYESELSNAGPLKQVGIDDQLNPLNPVSGYQQATPSTPNTEFFSQTVNPPLLDGTKGFPVTVSGPETIASVNPFEKQFSSLNERLDRLEDGIASLLGNRGQGMYMASQPNREGVGSLFPFYGGFYG
jgi:hypothetical protein